MIPDKTYNKLYNALKEYHAGIKDSAKEDYVPQFCLTKLILELKKEGLTVIETNKLDELSLNENSD